MARLPLVILHGWSDNSSSFIPLKNWLVSKGFNPIDISLADYLSMNDEITLTDLGYAFQNALRIKGLPVTPHSFDIIVHSTGGLVVREYLRQVCGVSGPKSSPIMHACMLAPANFGSSWATLGKSVIGRLKKGWDWNHLFQSGQRILDALELASPYSWDLAENDLFNPNFAIFRPDNVLTTVLVGTIAYQGMESIVHEDGSDGTVRVSTANLNAHLIRADFVTSPQIIPRNVSRIALGVFHRNHGNIIDPNESAQADVWKKSLLDALTIDPADYPEHLLRCDAITAQTFAEGLQGDHPEWYHQYQHVVFRVRDQFGDPVNDYVIEFYQELGDPNDEVFQTFHKDVLQKVTTNTKEPNYRSFMIDTKELGAFLISHPQTKIDVSITAANLSDLIKYQSPAAGSPVFSKDDKSYILPNEPLLIDVVLPRYSEPQVFRL